MEKEERLSLGRIYYPVKVLGPGSRVGIWLNGCLRRCPGCISPEMQRYDPEKEVSVEEILGMVRQVPGPIDGFTISGGEPFFKPAALCRLVEALYPLQDDILIFTGFTFEELKARKEPEIERVLNCCAALVDGPYLREKGSRRGIGGSANQRCLVFRHQERYAGLEDKDRALQTLIYGGKVLTIGVPWEETTS